MANGYQEWGSLVRHGLWRMHRIYRSMYRQNLAEDAADGVNLRVPHFFIQGHGVTVAMCAYRWMRRNGRSSIGDWNAIVRTIASRVSGNSGKTACALIVCGRAGREFRPVRFVVSEEHVSAIAVGWGRWTLDCIERRAAAFAVLRKRRLAKTCVTCGKFDEKAPRWVGVANRYDCVLPMSMRNDKHDWREGIGPLLCIGCWNRQRRTYQQAKQVDETRLVINRTMKEIRDVADQDNRPASRVSGADDGGREVRAD